MGREVEKATAIPFSETPILLQTPKIHCRMKMFLGNRKRFMVEGRVHRYNPIQFTSMTYYRNSCLTFFICFPFILASCFPVNFINGSSVHPPLCLFPLLPLHLLLAIKSNRIIIILKRISKFSRFLRIFKFSEQIIMASIFSCFFIIMPMPLGRNNNFINRHFMIEHMSSSCSG